jgi:O-antigen/teichoic acid export membrane protein
MIGTFTKNTLMIFFTRVSALFLGLLASIIIARVLGPEGKGVYTLAILLPGLLLTFTNFGINPATVFYIGKKKYSPKEIFGNNIVITLLLGGIAILIGLIIIFFFSQKLFQGVEKEYLLLALPLVLFTLFFGFISCILIGLQKFKKYNFVYFLQGFCFLALIGVFLLSLNLDVKFTILAYVFSYVLACGILFFLTEKETNGVFLKPNWQYFKDVFSYGSRAFLGGIFVFFHTRIDRFLINFFINPPAVGLYSVSAGLAEGFWLLSLAASIVLFPKVASETDGKRLKEFTPLVCRNILFITFLMATLFFALSPWLVTFLYSERFLQSIKPFQILLIGSLAFCGMRILGNDLSARGKPMLVTYAVGISTILNIILNLLWIPKWGIIGAAWATSLSYLGMFMIVAFLYLKISGNKINEILLFKKSDLNFYKKFFQIKL